MWLQTFTILPPPFFWKHFLSRGNKTFFGGCFPPRRFLPSLEIPSPTSVFFPAAVGGNQEPTLLMHQRQTWKQLSRADIEHCPKTNAVATMATFSIPSSGNNKKNNNNIQGPGVAASSQNKEEVEGQVSPGAVWAMGLLPLVLSCRLGREGRRKREHTNTRGRHQSPRPCLLCFPLSDLRGKSDAQLATSNS